MVSQSSIRSVRILTSTLVGVSLFFLKGAGLDDPHRVLKGTGKVARHVVLEAASDLDRPALQALIAQALERAPRPMASGGRRRIAGVNQLVMMDSRTARNPASAEPVIAQVSA